MHTLRGLVGALPIPDARWSMGRSSHSLLSCGGFSFWRGRHSVACLRHVRARPRGKVACRCWVSRDTLAWCVLIKVSAARGVARVPMMQGAACFWSRGSWNSYVQIINNMTLNFNPIRRYVSMSHQSYKNEYFLMWGSIFSLFFGDN